MILYGIKNCNTVKSAMDWLKKHNVSFEFHDYKTKGISKDLLTSWIKQVGWESLLNRKGTAWRQLSESDKEAVTSAAAGIALMMNKTSVIKRPLLEKDGKVIMLGFDEAAYQKTFR